MPKNPQNDVVEIPVCHTLDCGNPSEAGVLFCAQHLPGAIQPENPRLAQAEVIITTVEQTRTELATRQLKVTQTQASLEQVSSHVGAVAVTMDSSAVVLDSMGLTIERISRLGLDAARLAQIVTQPGITASDALLQVVQSCTAMPKFAGRISMAIGAAGMIGIGIPIPPVALAAGVTSATFVGVGIMLNAACYIIESPFQAVAGAGHMLQGVVRLGEAMGQLGASGGQAVAMPLRVAGWGLGNMASLAGVASRATMSVARSTTYSSLLVDAVETHVSTTVKQVAVSYLAPVIARSERSLQVARARLANDEDALRRYAIGEWDRDMELRDRSLALAASISEDPNVLEHFSAPAV
jgi:hypothetical protein